MDFKNVDKLLKIMNKRKELEAAIIVEKKAFEEKIVLPKATLEDLQDQENELREEVLLELEKANKITLKRKDYIITYNIKRTRKIEDVEKLVTALYNNREKIQKDLGYEVSAIFQHAIKTEKVITDKPYMNEVISNYEKVEGEELDGIKIQETRYLTIK